MRTTPLSRGTSLAGILGTFALAVTLTACGSDSGSDAGAATDTTDTTDAAPNLTAAQQKQVDAGADAYAAFVKRETRLLLRGTASFVSAYQSSDDDRARALYPTTRAHWEAIEPVAETFGDLDPKTDAREADLEPGQEWTGWHLLEKDLWPQDAGAGYRPLTQAERKEYSDRLLKDLRALRGQVKNADYTGEQIAAGAKELLDEVAEGKVTGEEEIWSHTDLYDFAANVRGAKKSFTVLAPVVKQTDPELATTLKERFAALDAELAKYRTKQGFVPYTDLSEAEVKLLSDSVNALSEPLSQLAAAVAS